MDVMRDLIGLYSHAKSMLEASKFAQEISWQKARDVGSVTESEFLREVAWVILCSGFREAVVRKRFNYISLCFCDWESAEAILEREGACRISALSAIKNEAKINAIIEAAKKVYIQGFSILKSKILNNPIKELSSFPFIGDITVWHLAKNLGLPVAKPDRHLVRLAKKYGSDDVQSMCKRISDCSGDPIQVVDLILWRYLSETKGLMAY